MLTAFGTSATALPGLIILKLHPNFLHDTIGKFPERIVMITGTNGKTTTAHLLVHMLRKSGFRVFHNSEGSNMERGIASEILKNINMNGGQTGRSPSINSGQSVPTNDNSVVGDDLRVVPHLLFDFFVIEGDEGSFPRLLQELNPKTVLLLNIFRDQLDRYGEINGLMSKWEIALKKNPTEKIIFNADDPNVTWVVSNVVTGQCPVTTEKIGFSVETRSLASLHGDTNPDRVFCPKCNGILKYEGTDFKCEKCGFGKMKVEYILREVETRNCASLLTFNNEPIGFPIFGKYNYYNLAGACAAFLSVGAQHVVPLHKLLEDFSPAFGRFQKIQYHDKFFHVILAKNPAGMNNVLETLFPVGAQHVVPLQFNLMFGLNDKIADGEDVSWIYDVDYEGMISVGAQHVVPLQLIISGTRAFDLALRLKIAFRGDAVQCKQFKIVPDIKQAFDEFLKRVEKSESSFAIVTYTCLMELQKIMYQKKLINKLM